MDISDAMLEELMEGDCDYIPTRQLSVPQNRPIDSSTYALRVTNPATVQVSTESDMLDPLYMEEALFGAQLRSLKVSSNEGFNARECKEERPFETKQYSQRNAPANSSHSMQTPKSFSSDKSIQKHNLADARQNSVSAHQEFTPALSASEYIKANQLHLHAKCDASLVYQLAERKLDMLRKRLASMVFTDTFDFTIAESYFDDASGDLIVKPQCSLKVRATIKSTTLEYSSPRNAILWTRLIGRVLPVENESKAAANDIAFEEKLKYTFRTPIGSKYSNQTEVVSRIDALKQRCCAILQTQLHAIFQLDQRPTSEGHSSTLPSLISFPLQHSIGHTLFDFAAVFHRVYGAFIIEESKKSPPGTQILWQLLPLAATDIKQVAEILSTLIIKRYPHLHFEQETNNLETQEIRKFTNDCVYETVLNTIIHHLTPTVQSIYTCAYALEDQFFANFCEELRSEPAKLYEALDLAKKTTGNHMDQLKSLYDSYKEAIVLMEELNLDDTLSILLQKCTRICDLIQSINHRSRMPLDMRKSVAFVIIASPRASRQTYSRLAMLGSLSRYSISTSESSVTGLNDLAGAVEHLTSYFISLHT
uniref:AlNc14C375G11155 protein n=1 Tax=Albugo laibachii Nc14 TaxID=890382 RepID=F0WY95_9STRA|nr:AlNc14C375G11155 [Albugo laibachii Nc14]|eukprot:CCA26447.1 AlNc14C375G11155 [Albugo laibachii Nc14]